MMCSAESRVTLGKRLEVLLPKKMCLDLHLVSGGRNLVLFTAGPRNS